MEILHHGAVNGVTGSCHELLIGGTDSVLVDCGLFQGTDLPDDSTTGVPLDIGFPVDRIRALLVTHTHIDHVGRIPHLMAAGFRGPIYCSEPTAILLPLMLEDVLRMGLTRNPRLITSFLKQVDSHLSPLSYNHWWEIPITDPENRLEVRLRQAGHILGSAYIECRLREQKQTTRVLFSGDLGAPYTPLLPSPKAPWSTDLLVLESTYGDRLHEGRKERRQQLRGLVERCFRNRGVILIPAFSIGRTQELLYELEEIIHRYADRVAAKGLDWEDLEIVLDSPLATRFTEAYRQLKPFWDLEAKGRLRQGRHPLSFEQLTTIQDHETHMNTVAYLQRSSRPTIVIAGAGMCTGGRIVNYLKALLGDPRTDVLFVGYQAKGTPGRDIQQYGPRQGYVVLDGKPVDIRAGIYILGGYSAHGDQKDLVNFVRRMRHKPREIRLVHGEYEAKQALSRKLRVVCPEADIKS